MPATREEILSRVKEITGDALGFAASSLEENHHFMDDLGADSLDGVETFMEVEKYVEAFFENLNWQVVEENFGQARK